MAEWPKIQPRTKVIDPVYKDGNAEFAKAFAAMSELDGKVTEFYTNGVMKAGMDARKLIATIMPILKGVKKDIAIVRGNRKIEKLKASKKSKK
jgi:hypothetical protein